MAIIWPVSSRGFLTKSCNTNASNRNPGAKPSCRLGLTGRKLTWSRSTRIYRSYLLAIVNELKAPLVLEVVRNHAWYSVYVGWLAGLLQRRQQLKYKGWMFGLRHFTLTRNNVTIRCHRTSTVWNKINVCGGRVGGCVFGIGEWHH